jgi:hypothetical protein
MSAIAIGGRQWAQGDRECAGRWAALAWLLKTKVYCEVRQAYSLTAMEHPTSPACLPANNLDVACFVVSPAKTLAAAIWGQFFRRVH